MSPIAKAISSGDDAVKTLVATIWSGLGSSVTPTSAPSWPVCKADETRGGLVTSCSEGACPGDNPETSIDGSVAAAGLAIGAAVAAAVVPGIDDVPLAKEPIVGEPSVERTARGAD